MSQFSFSNREFMQDPSKAKHAAREGPVYITERGRPSHVLLTIEQYERLSGASRNIVDALGMAEAAPNFTPQLLSG